jgi:hypothetical protein
LLAMLAPLAIAGCQSSTPSKAEQDRVARAMVKVEAEQAESDRSLRARNKANDQQVLIGNQQAQ